LIQNGEKPGISLCLSAIFNVPVINNHFQ